MELPEKKIKTKGIIIRIVISLLIICALALFLIFAYYFMLAPQVEKLSPNKSTLNVALDSSVVISFNKPIDRDSLIATIEPEVDGEWIYEDPIITKHLFRTLRFVPNQSLRPETEYRVQLENIKSIYDLSDSKTITYGFTTRSLPDISSVIPADEKTGLSPETTFKINLTEPNPDLAEFEFLFEPEIEFTKAVNNSLDQYTLTPNQPLVQGADYKLVINRIWMVKDKQSHEVVFQDEPKKLYQGSYKTAPPPKVEEVGPTGDDIHVDENISITFSQAMDETSIKGNLSISPDTQGLISLSDNNKILTFTPEFLSYETEYQVTIPVGTKNAQGGYLVEDINFSFNTIGRVSVSHLSPQDGTTGVGINNTIRVSFDQEVDRASAESKFQIDPAHQGEFSWDGNTMIFTPSGDLAYNYTYQLTIHSGIKSTYGLDSDQDYKVKFATAPETIKLAIAQDFQDQSLSCEAAALKMALSYKGISVTETEIMDLVGYDSTSHQGNVWGDPYLAYVGDISGRQNTTGYGVYWDPIARAADQWRSAEAFTGWTVAQLTHEIAQGNPVITWGIYGSGYEDSWYTQDGKYIYAWKGEHARTVVGFVGNAENPSKIILNDPYAGVLYWTTDRFEQDWNIFNNSGVVVR